MAFAPHGRRKDELYRLIQQINAQHRIGISIPGPNASAHHGNPAFEIYSRLEAHYEARGIESLEALLAQFQLKVEQFWALFTRKPQSGVGPLRALLHDVLDKADGTAWEPRPYGRVQHQPVNLEQPSGQNLQSTHAPNASKTPTKRQTDIRQHFPNKRPKKVKFVEDSKTAFPIDGTPRVEQLDGPGIFAAKNNASCSRRQGQTCQSFTSVNTNETSFSSVFSAARDPQDTQESHGSPTSETQDALATLAQSFHTTVQPQIAHNGQNCSSPAPAPAPGTKDPVREQKTQDQIAAISKQLQSIWPKLPPWLSAAPFPVRWEVTRIALSCGVDLATVDLQDMLDWQDQKLVRTALWKHPAFQGKAFPESSPSPAWAASLDKSLLAFDQHVVYTASLELVKGSGKKSKTSMQLMLQPLKLEQSYRLARFYGADRFLELLIPSPDYSNLRTLVEDAENFFKALVLWLINSHELCGRTWKAFYTKSGGSRKPQKDLQFGSEPRLMYKERIYFFAEDDQVDGEFPRVSLKQMLKWALSLRTAKNRKQPSLKLFQRLALRKFQQFDLTRIFIDASS